MANNVTLNEQTGTAGAVIRSLETVVGGVTAQEQVVQLSFGGTASAGTVSAGNPLPVIVQSISATSVVSGTNLDLTGSSLAAMKALQGAVTGSAVAVVGALDSISATVTVASSNIDLSGSAKTVLDNIRTAVELLDNAVSGSAIAVVGTLDAISATVTVSSTNIDLTGSALAALKALQGAVTGSAIAIVGALDSISATVTIAGTNIDLTGSAKTALTTLEGAIKAEDAVHNSGDSGIMPLAVRRDNQAASSGADGDYEPLQTDAFGGLRITPYEAPGRTDVFGRSMIASANNDIDIQFFRGAPETLVQVTTANSATATSNIGGALFASSTDANGSVQGVTRQTTVYRSGSEIYCMFTASFTAGIASSFMRIGLYDANNGFFVGYEGTSFGVTYRNNASDTTVAKGSFSEDTLTGAAGSRFTRAGVAEAIDLTKLNVFRIRFGWLGSAPAYWEVMAPDGHWVVFHKTLFPNLQANPSIRDADLPMTIDITKTAAAATDLQIQTDCWGAGATLTEQSGIVDPLNSRFASTLTANTSWNASGPWVDVHRYSLTKILIYSSTNNAAGTLQVEFSMDGSTVHRTVNYDVDNAADHPPHVLIPVAQFMRVSYDADAGGGNNHADFTVQTIHHVNANKLPTSKVTSTLDDDTDVDNVRAVIAGENPAAGGSYVNVRVDASGQLQCDIAADSVGLATEATLGSIKTAVELLDNAVTGSAVAVVGALDSISATVTVASTNIDLTGSAKAALIALESAVLSSSAVVVNYGPRDTAFDRQAQISATAAAVLMTASASVFHDCTSIQLSNLGGSNQVVSIYDRSATGTPKFKYNLAASGGGVAVSFPDPIKQTTAGAAWNIKLDTTAVDVFYCITFRSR